jgi:hypothetical protein
LNGQRLHDKFMKVLLRRSQTLLAVPEMCFDIILLETQIRPSIAVRPYVHCMPETSTDILAGVCGLQDHEECMNAWMAVRALKFMKVY